MTWAITDYKDGREDPSGYPYAEHDFEFKDWKVLKGYKTITGVAIVHYWSGRVFDFCALEEVKFHPRAPWGCRTELIQLVIDGLKKNHEDLEIEIKGWVEPIPTGRQNNR